jgi:hypothetical protein
MIPAWSWCLLLLSSIIIISYGSTWALFFPIVPTSAWFTAARLQDRGVGQLYCPNHHGTRRRGIVLQLTTGPITTSAKNTNTTTMAAAAAAAATADDCNKKGKHWNAMFAKLKAYKEV